MPQTLFGLQTEVLVRNFHTAVVERNVAWAGGELATEPYEAGWASEALCFIRVLSVEGKGSLKLRAQISPDGMRWIDEGTSFESIESGDLVDLHFIKLLNFGNWLRVAGQAEGDASFRIIVYWTLKE